MRALRNLIILFVLSYFPFAAMASEYYVCQAYYGGSAPILKIDEAGNVLDSIPIVLNGESSKGCFGLAAHPKTNKLYAMIDVIDYDEGNRTIVEVDEKTGLAREIVDLDDYFVNHAFDADGNLYLLGGETCHDCAFVDAAWVYKVDLATGDISLFSDAFGDIENDPHSMAFNPEDGYMYYRGRGDFFGNSTDFDVLAKMDLNTGNIVDTVLLTGDSEIPEYAFVWDPIKQTFFGIHDVGDTEISEMTADGVVTLIDDTLTTFTPDGYPRGIAIKVATFDVPTLSAAGLGLLALLLGAIGVLVYRRKPKL